MDWIAALTMFARNDERRIMMPSFLKRAWRGEEKLWKVFWLYGLGGLVVPFVISLIGSFIIFRSSHHLWGLIPSTGLLAGFILYFIVWSLALWKCRANLNHKFWTYPAGLYYLFCLTFPVCTCFFGYWVLDFNLDSKWDNYQYHACDTSIDSGCIQDTLGLILKILRIGESGQLQSHPSMRFQ